MLNPLHLQVTEDMRVTADDLIIDAFEYLSDVEFTIFTSNLSMQGDLEQQVSKLLAHMIRIICIQGNQGFIGLFQQVVAQGLVVLFPIPWATIGGTPMSDTLRKSFEGGAFFH